jgi:hypothetical protein
LLEFSLALFVTLEAFYLLPLTSTQLPWTISLPNHVFRRTWLRFRVEFLKLDIRSFARFSTTRTSPSCFPSFSTFVNTTTTSLNIHAIECGLHASANESHPQTRGGYTPHSPPLLLLSVVCDSPRRPLLERGLQVLVRGLHAQAPITSSLSSSLRMMMLLFNYF